MYRRTCVVVCLAVLCTVGSISARAGSWTPVPGSLSQIAVGSKNTIWGLNSAGSVFEYNGSGGWIQIPGTLAQISVSGDYAVVGVNSANQVFSYDFHTGLWKNKGFTATKVYTGGQYIDWGLLVNGSGVGRFDPGTNALDNYTTPLLTQISVSCDGNVWGLTASGEIFAFNQQSQQFEQIAGSLSQIAVGFGNAVFGINSAGNVFQFDNAAGYFVQLPGTLSKIAVGSNESVYGLNSAGNIWQYNVASKTWTQLPGVLAQLAVAPDGTLWGINSSGGIFYYTP